MARLAKPLDPFPRWYISADYKSECLTYKGKDNLDYKELKSKIDNKENFTIILSALTF